MKRARFFAHSHYHEGILAEPGILLDEAGQLHREDEVIFLPPVVPHSVIGLALNFADHAAELAIATPEEPALFFKPPNTWIGHRAPVIYPAGVQYMHYEVELAVVIGQRCRKVLTSDALSVVRGYTIGNDVTVRDFIGNFYRPPVRAKGWDTFCPLGPYLVTGEIADPHALQLRAYVNGELRQHANTQQLLRKVPELIEFISSFMTLEADDVILTGTPRGISHVYPGDVMRLEIDGIGALENPVVAEG
ncbi:MAG TPA: fumarylacetoacetate hydrolase family protein [Ktedonobacteraceae bacterium]|jgi:5-oxopent-3-ene-1,2,5-tricarboxylate decarboxylase / 2-hydroxyhepta-2,4-diene-1,7-dioate isomerase|nr:fumarylacetoacetate hydrolase family protein [Ktedonobacteraceae bacterium]